MITLRKGNPIGMMAVFILLVLSKGVSFGAAGDETLLAKAKQIFSPLPPVMSSDQNPVTPQKVKLGRMLFYETRISVDGAVSCAK